MTSYIFLIGFMGSGKSTIGKLLAHELKYTFIDLDSYIESSHHNSIAELFAKHGENGFRIIEKEALHELQSLQQIVVACGGGAPCFFDNMDWMKSIGEVIFLHCSPDSLFGRLKYEQAHRPLIRDFEPQALKQFIIKKLDERMPFYTQANIQLFELKDKSASTQWIIETLKST
ncbi:MAG: shikimate kinase [Saprospiraceae bacterium]